MSPIVWQNRDMSYSFNIDPVLNKDNLTPSELLRVNEDMRIISKIADSAAPHLNACLYNIAKQLPSECKSFHIRHGLALALKTEMLKAYQEEIRENPTMDRTRLVKTIADSIEKVLLSSGENSTK